MVKPMLCELRKEPFNDDRYLWEIKYDGMRSVAGVMNSNYSIQSRSGKDKTSMFPELNLETRAPALLDGELVCYKEGKMIFRGVQRRANRLKEVALMSELYPATYEVFDILMVEGENLEYLPLEERKRILEQVLIPTDNVRMAPFTSDAVTLFNEAQANADHYNLTGEILGHKEGAVGKLKAGTYRQNKRDWLKVKTFQSGEFVICGYTQGTGWRTSTFGALLLGKYIKGGLIHVGSVGTGFDDNEIRRLYQRMLTLQGADCPFSVEPEPATWVKPVISVMIQYLELTDDGKLRFPSYKGTTN